MSKRSKTTKTPPLPDQRDQPDDIVRILRRRFRVLGVVTALLAVLVLVLAMALDVMPISVHILPGSGAGDQSITNPDARLAEFYRPEVLYWREEIHDWAQEYTVNPNVIAIVMQIESCGGPTAISIAGATGLMQVMPFHFDNGENMLNPDTNVRRGMSVFYECLTVFANWDLGLALACYNGGPRVTRIDSSNWAAETRSYYKWATGLWKDVRDGNESSDTLDEWLAAGGLRLCEQTANYLFPPDERR